ANMSHELRTPLNSIIGFSELLVEQTSDRLIVREQRYLEDVLTSGRHLLSLINDILDLSKIEAGHVTLELDAVRPSIAITEARELVDSQAMRRKVEIRSDIRCDIPARADQGKLRQVLLNLVSNAIKFSPENGTVVVGAEEAGDMMRFFVCDSGPGVDESLRQRLFQPFVQGESPLVKSFQGTGLGLAISKRLVEQHGGQIEVISPPGEGATFRFTIPKAERSAGSLARNSDGPLVLVVDDDRRSSGAIKDILNDAGYNVTNVEPGSDPSEMVSRLMPAALVVNPATDERDTLRIIDQLKRGNDTREVAIVVTSAPRAAEFVPKPIETKRFLQEIKDIAPISATSGAPLILVIDDDPRVGSLLSGLLAPAGYEVQAFERGRLGIEAAQIKTPALVIVDLLMPEMSGFEVIDALVSDERTRNIPIFVLTAADTSDGDRARLKQHVRAIAQKGSITREDLLAAVGRATGRIKPAAIPDGKTILVIDDHDLNRELARSLLEHLGYRVLLAEDGDAGIATALKEQPALVFMDLAMPKKDGFTAARELKNNGKTARIPIVALTAMAMRGDEEKAFAAGMDAYLTKPIDRKALESVLARFVSLKTS
ncbi:MAG: response regulator, partial [Clostridia bacterium]|nr:response regulator [Deltaproteobacteria bacterium]